MDIGYGSVLYYFICLFNKLNFSDAIAIITYIKYISLKLPNLLFLLQRYRYKAFSGELPSWNLVYSKMLQLQVKRPPSAPTSEGTIFREASLTIR